MSDINAEWREKRRWRWMRPNAHLAIRHDAWRFMPPGAPRYVGKDVVRYFWPDSAGDWWTAECKADAAAVDESAEIAAEIETLLALKRELDAIKLQLKFRRLLRDRKYSPDQPRVPAGNPDGGQWTEADGTSGSAGRNDSRVASDATPGNDWMPGAQYAQNEPPNSGRDRASGHHYVPQALYEKEPLLPETRKVFEEGKTGRLYDDRSNKYDGPHRTYNQAVTNLFNDFKSKNNIQSEQMTPDQARSFLNEVATSPDPRIRNFNMRIQFREIMYRVFRGIRGGHQ